MSDRKGSPRLKKLITAMLLLLIVGATFSMSDSDIRGLFLVCRIAFRLQLTQCRLHCTVFSTMIPRFGVVYSDSEDLASALVVFVNSRQVRQRLMGMMPRASDLLKAVAVGPLKISSSVFTCRSPMWPLPSMSTQLHETVMSELMQML